MEELQNKVLKYKNYLETNQNGGKISYIFDRLAEMPISVSILQNTGIGKVVNGFRKRDGDIGIKAKVVVTAWKNLVAEEQLRLEAENLSEETANENGTVDNSPSNEEEDEDNIYNEERDNLDDNEYHHGHEKYTDGDIQGHSVKVKDIQGHSVKVKDKHKERSYKHDKHQENNINETKKSKSSHSNRHTSHSDNQSSQSDKLSARSDRQTSKSDKHDSQSDRHKSYSDKQRGSSDSHSDRRSHCDRQTSKSDKHDSQSDRHKSHSDKQRGSSDSHSDRHSHSDKYRSTGSSDNDKQGSHSEKLTTLKDKHHIHNDKQKHESEKSSHEHLKHNNCDEDIEMDYKNRNETKEKIHADKSLKIEKDYKNKNEKNGKAKHEDSKNISIGSDKKKIEIAHVDTKTHSTNYSGNTSYSDRKNDNESKDSKNERKSHRDTESMESEGKSSDRHSGKHRKSHSNDENKKTSSRHGSSKSHESKDSSRSHSSHKAQSEKENGSSSRSCSSHKGQSGKENESTSSISRSNSGCEKQEKGHSGYLETDGNMKLELMEQLGSENKESSRPLGKESSRLESTKSSKSESKDKSREVRAKEKGSRSEGKDSSNSGGKDSSRSDGKDSSRSDGKDSSRSEGKEKSRSENKETSRSENKESSKCRSENKTKSESKDGSKLSGKSNHGSKRDKSKSHKSNDESQSKHSSKSDKKDKKSKSSSYKDKDCKSKSKEPAVEFLTFDEPDVHKKTSKIDYEKLKAKFKIKKKGEPSQKLLAPSKEFPVVKRKNDDQESPVASKMARLDPMLDDEPYSLPATQTHYRPWRFAQLEDTKKKTDALDDGAAWTKSNTRTQVYSGKKQLYVPEVYRLYDICLQTLMNNIDGLDFVGGVPYDIMKPVLEKCTPQQLYRLEDCNPVFLEDTDDMWKRHCDREFKSCKPEELESWREMYWRKHDEREEKLHSLKNSISAHMAQKLPVKTTKLAYVDSAVKPPREVLRQQIKYGTAGSSSGERSKRFSHLMEPMAISRTTNAKRMAPMMQKTMSMIKKIRK